MRYDAHSGIAVLHGVGILDKGNQMAEPTSYTVEIDEQGNTSTKYADGTPYAVNIAEYSAEVLNDATFSEGLNSVECNVTVKIGGLEFGPFSFVYDNIPGGDDDAKQDEDVALPEAD